MKPFATLHYLHCFLQRRDFLFNLCHTPPFLPHSYYHTPHPSPHSHYHTPPHVTTHPRPAAQTTVISLIWMTTTTTRTPGTLHPGPRPCGRLPRGHPSPCPPCPSPQSWGRPTRMSSSPPSSTRRCQWKVLFPILSSLSSLSSSHSCHFPTPYTSIWADLHLHTHTLHIPPPYQLSATP